MYKCVNGEGAHHTHTRVKKKKQHKIKSDICSAEQIIKVYALKKTN